MKDFMASLAYTNALLSAMFAVMLVLGVMIQTKLDNITELLITMSTKMDIIYDIVVKNN